MTDSCFIADTVDDLIHEVVEAVRDRGIRIIPTKGPADELQGILLVLKNPRARLSRSETRGRPLSALAELCWYLTGEGDPALMLHYLPKKYNDLIEDGRVYGAYGERLFKHRGTNQLERVVEILSKKPDSRQAVIQIFDADDLLVPHKHVPCTCTLQFLKRGDLLYLITTMRSNDVYLGLPHDIFCFTMLQELVARQLGLDIGDYRHFVGSLHVYVEHWDALGQYLAEGWHATDLAMPPMPGGDPWPAIRSLLQCESTLRAGRPVDPAIVDSLDPYWQDLVHLFTAYQHYRRRDRDQVLALRGRLHHEGYRTFIDGMADRIDS